jgi:hypothetical protein
MIVSDCAHGTIRGQSGGEGGIRTPDTVARMPHFECGAFNHSATSPGALRAGRDLGSGGYARRLARWSRAGAVIAGGAALHKGSAGDIFAVGAKFA